MTMLTIENLEYSYGKIKALNGISATVNTGEIVSIVGANGAGKSTLMRCIAGLLKPKSGEILYDGKPLPHTPHEVVARGISLVPEGRWIFPNLSVEENLLMGGYLVKDRSAGIARSFAMFPRLEERRHQRAGTLSGGEQQMLAIARGLMSDPKLLCWMSRRSVWLRSSSMMSSTSFSRSIKKALRCCWWNRMRAKP